LRNKLKEINGQSFIRFKADNMTKQSVCSDEFRRGAECAAAEARNFNGATTHPYDLGDCVLAKLNLIPKRKVRPNSESGVSECARKREQKLIDICFACVMLCNDKQHRAMFEKMTREELADWVTKQLRGSGFNTEPCGSSWGVLKNE